MKLRSLANGGAVEVSDALGKRLLKSGSWEALEAEDKKPAEKKPSAAPRAKKKAAPRRSPQRPKKSAPSAE